MIKLNNQKFKWSINKKKVKKIKLLLIWNNNYNQFKWKIIKIYQNYLKKRMNYINSKKKFKNKNHKWS